MDMKSEIVSTGLTVEKRKFTWRIDNFDAVRKSDMVIKAQKFRFKAGESIDLETEWLFYLSPRNYMVGEETLWIGMYLQLTKAPDNVQEVSASCKMSIKRPGTWPLGGKSFQKDYFPSAPGWGYSVVRKDTNLDDLPLVDGSLLVDIEFHLFAPAKITIALNGTGFIEAEFERKFLKKLQSDLGNFFDSSDKHSPVETKIISKDNVEFGVIVGILSARSPVFKAMLGTDMEESNTGVIHIDELSSKTVSVLLRFICTGKLHVEWSKPEVIVQLVYAAEKYQLPDLVEFLDNVLGVVATKETGVKLFNLAKKLGMKKAEKELFQKMKRDLCNSDDLMTLIDQCSESDILS